MLSSDDTTSDENEPTDICSNHNCVKSTAVVKYSAVDSPANFALLQCNTDLNLPPANWLSSSAESYGLQYVLSNTTGFSSFRMADMFPDCVGEVDVVSDAENIKKLLKLPYSQGPVSMLVHRIKTTLLIDDFDFQRVLFRSAGVNWDHTWKNLLLKRVFESSEKSGKSIADESKRRYVLQQENLISKFLYHSIGQLEKKDPVKFKNENKSQSNSSTHRPPLPEPNIRSELPDTDNEHTFIRNVVWTFENIQMLLGNDMPIFGGGTHPCVSLRLKDMSKPISVLTGIDYWLDNLMCNVPEVAMCYHIGGIVQKYELIKTEDLPYMEDSSFSPLLIRDVAQNILAFLKSNATKAGHTYWLLKGKDDDVVKLYDLTSLCSSSMDDAQNPFTIPVALLLYRVARNMKHSPRVQSPTNPATIRMLLANCIKLLPKEKYPEIIMSAHYMFSDSLIPLNTDPAAPKLEDVGENVFSDKRKGIHHSNQKTDDVFDVNVKSLCLSHKQSYSGDNASDVLGNDEEFEFTRNIENRCKSALEHIAHGLNCLKYFDMNSKYSKENEEEPHRTHPSQAIPMPYEPIEKGKTETVKEEKINSGKKKKKNPKKKEEPLSIGALLCKSHLETMPTWQQPPNEDDSRAWKQHLRTLLWEKACLVYATLAEHEYSVEDYGNSLKHIRMVLESRVRLDNTSCENILMSYLLGRAGDCCFQIGRKLNQMDKYRKDYTEFEAEGFDAKMKAVMIEEEKVNYNELSFLPSEITTLDKILQNSWMCYSKALELETREVERDNLQRRLGNICNELGSYYMKEAREAQEDPEFPKQKLEALFAVSSTHLECGIKAFKAVGDDANLALLYSNTGRLNRLMAHYYAEENSPLNKTAKSYYGKALSNYQSALTALSYRRLNPAIWDTVFFEMSTTLYNMAKLLQEYPTQSTTMNQSDLEREVAEYLSKALKYCDMELPGPKQPLYQYRAADIHHRLGSLYHNVYRNLDKDSARRSKILQLCNLHYERAIKLLQMLELPSQFLRVQLEKIALYEYIAEDTTAVSTKIKTLQTALDLVLQSEQILKMMCDRNVTENISSKQLNVKEESKSDSFEEKADQVKDHDDRLQKRDDVRISNDCEKEMCEQTENPSCYKNKDEDGTDEVAEEQKMIELMEARLQFILRSLIKLCSSSVKYSNVVPKYKDMYSALLRSSIEKGMSLEQRLYNIISQNIHVNELIVQ